MMRNSAVKPSQMFVILVNCKFQKREAPVVAVVKYCEAQGKGRARGGPRKVTQRSFMDGGWWISFP